MQKFKIPELEGIEESKAKKIKKTFEPMFEMLTGFEGAYNNLMAESSNGITKDITEKAKRLRIDIGQVRIKTGKLKDKQKEYIKLEDKAIMGVHNILVWAVKEHEDRLKEIEKHFEIQEQKRLEALQNERVLLLSEHVDDAHERDLYKFEEDEFQALLAMKKREQEDRIEAERLAEIERKEKEEFERLERERIEAENERLRKEAQERERLTKIKEEERNAKEEAERKIREEKERKERAEYEAKIKAEREARAKIEREEKAKREKLEAELKAKEEAERKKNEEEAAKIQAELMKGDAEKVNDLVKDLKALGIKYTFESEKNKKMYSGVCKLLSKVIAYIQK